MKELISEQQAEWIVAALCLAVLFIGPAVAWKRTRSVRPAVFFACLAPLVYLLWRVYNAIENYYGLDSVKALGINAVLILGTGAVLPFIYSAYCRRPSPETRKR